MIPVLQTERLILRAPENMDFPTYRDFYASASGSGNYGGPLPAKGAWMRLAADVGHWALRGYGMFSIVPRASGAMVGGCGLFRPEGWPSHELTWWLLGSSRGCGYAVEASRAVIAWAYDVLGWAAVETHMRDENAPARRLAERLNGSIIRRETFPDGVDRDAYLLPGSCSRSTQ